MSEGGFRSRPRSLRLGTNIPRVGDYNQLVVFDLIRRAKTGISRAEAVAETGLSPQTVSNVVNRLLELEWVREGQRVHRSGRGKPRTLLHSQADAAYAVGVHLEPSPIISAVLMDTNGTIRRRANTDSIPDPDDAVATIGRLCAELIDGIPVERVLGIGCSVPGPIDLDRGTFIDPPTLPGWDNFPFLQQVHNATGLTVYMQKDSIAALAGELWNRDRGLDRTTLFVYAGFGIAFAVARGRELFVGGSGNAGEAGHIKVSIDSAPCSCGRQGCVGKIIEFEYVVEQAVARGILPDRDRKWNHTELVAGMDAIATMARDGNAVAQDLLAESVDAIAEAVVIMADFLDATDVVIGGTHAARLAPQLSHAVEREFSRYSVLAPIHSLTVHDADFAAWVGAAGGASLVFDAQMSPTSTVLTGRASTGKQA